MHDNSELIQLRCNIDRWSAAYYRGIALVPDATYDAALARLRVLAPDDERHTRVGPPPKPGADKVKHPVPMGSLDNTDNGILGLDDWYDRQAKQLGRDPGAIHLSLKADGSSVSALYQDGVRTQVLSRGNGI